MRKIAVFDTNILFSGVGWKGKPFLCLELACAGVVDGVTCRELLDELAEKLQFFRALYPHPADKSALRAEGATHSWHPGNVCGPVGGPYRPLETVRCSTKKALPDHRGVVRQRHRRGIRSRSSGRPLATIPGVAQAHQGDDSRPNERTRLGE